MKKRLFAVLLAVLMIASLGTVAAFADTTITDVSSLKSAVESAEPGATIIVPEGTYAVEGWTITKNVNLEAAENAEVTFQGQILYRISDSSAENKSISISGIDFVATNSHGNQAVCLSTGVSNYALNIENCTFDGYQYGVTANAGAEKCVINLENVVFKDTGCATSLKTSDGNKIGSFDSVTLGATYAVQVFGSPAAKLNGYYMTFEKYSADSEDGSYSDFDYDANNEYEDIVVFSTQQLQNAINGGHDTIRVAAGIYTGDISFNGKSVTLIGANAGIDPNSNTPRVAETIFNGTMSTYGTSYNENQSVIIDGFTFTGNGLKVGDANYNSVGNLAVQNCIMETGDNLESATVGHNNLNYLIKVNGDPNYGFASVKVINNKIAGKAVENIFPIQLWHVSYAEVTGNVIELTNAENIQAVGVSKMSKDAEVVITNNEISGAGGGIFVTTWKVNDGTDINYEGNVTIRNNNIAGADDGKAIYVGWDNADDYSKYAGTLLSHRNIADGESLIVIPHNPEDSGVSLLTVTFKDGDNITRAITVPAGSDGTAAIIINYSIEVPGFTFLGWSDGETLYEVGDTVTVSENTELTAVFRSNAPEEPPVNIPDTYDIELIVGEGGEAKASYSNASTGTTITITVAPDEGYELDYITVDGERISGTTFKMPDHDVTVRVYFTDGTSALPFTDVTANQWFYEAVSYVYTNGMMEGDSATTFNPDGQMTRAMFWAVLGRIDGANITGANWIETARSWAMSKGVSDGTDPNGLVTREMMVTMLWRYAGEPASDESLSGYSDAASVSDWAAEAMSWALETGVIEGVTATTLQPQGTATRAQCATIFMRYDALVA